MAIGGRDRACFRDYSVDDSNRFPAFVEPSVAPAPTPPIPGVKTISSQIEKWKEYSEGKRAGSTARRYPPSLRSFMAYLKDKDIRLVTDDNTRLGPSIVATSTTSRSPP